MTQLTYGSLFSGIGGIDLGLDRAGMYGKWQVEIDEYASKVLAKHWPNVARYGDIRECGAHNLEPVDLICGGFPCQDISNAGKRAGIEGERSGLWKEFYRVICELRPSFVLVENVSALLHRGIERVLGDLAASGYDAEWQVLSAEAFGAPHLRERVFIVAYPNIFSSCSRTEIPQERRANTSFHGQELAHTSGQRLQTVQQEYRHLQEKSTQGHFSCRCSPIFRGPISRRPIWTTEPNVGRVANGIPSRVDRLKGLGNAVVPQVAEYVGRCILDAIEAEEVAG